MGSLAQNATLLKLNYFNRYSKQDEDEDEDYYYERKCKPLIGLREYYSSQSIFFEFIKHKFNIFMLSENISLTEISLNCDDAKLSEIINNVYFIIVVCFHFYISFTLEKVP